MVTQIKREGLEYYLSLKYPVSLTPDVTGGYVAEMEDLPGCFSQGDTPEEAFANIEEARQLWIEVAYEDGQEIPLPRTEEAYSGKFNVRIPKSLHRKLDLMADREGVSLNQYLMFSLARSVGLEEGRLGKNRKAAASK